ncbi:MAG: flagellar protein FliT [Pseudohongiella sp.]|uniref:flagellar protein FliT n=1 Tax=Pseudohongiella sp. TaxID=1979412 RepID=UPI00349FF831
MAPPDQHPDYTTARARQQAAWQDIMAVSEQLLHSAKRQDWENIDLLHARREHLLDQFFRETLVQDMIPTVQQGIKNIREQDSDIVQMVKNNRDQLGAESKRLQLMKTRVKGYLSADK